MVLIGINVSLDKDKFNFHWKELFCKMTQKAFFPLKEKSTHKNDLFTFKCKEVILSKFIVK